MYKLSFAKQSQYAYSDAEKEKLISQWTKKAPGAKGGAGVQNILPVEISENEGQEAETENAKGITIQRYKGLGEMNPQQLWETTMDPKARYLYQVGIDDAEAANEIFETLMGNEVAPRKKFIHAHARAVKNLDI